MITAGRSSPETIKSEKMGPSQQLLESVKALLLVGGEGTRLRSVVSAWPKPLASVGDRPFLELLVRQLKIQGICQLVLCTGYRAEQVERTFENGRKLGVSIEYSREAAPLGTAGAVRLARPHLDKVADFLVLNGDSFLEINFQQLIEFHRQHGGVATITAVPVLNTGRYGALELDASNKVTRFTEKNGSQDPGLINGGIYVFSHTVLDLIPEGQVGLEKDVLPRLLTFGVYALEQHGMFIDIGTPADYARAQELYQQLSEAASQPQPDPAGHRV